MENKLITLNNLDEYNIATREYINEHVRTVVEKAVVGDVSVYWLNGTSSSVAIPVMQTVLEDYNAGGHPVVIAQRASLTDEDAGLFQVASVGTTTMYLYNTGGMSTSVTTTSEYGYPDKLKLKSSFGCTIKCTIADGIVTAVTFTNDTNTMTYADRNNIVNKTWFEKEFQPKNLSYIGHYDSAGDLPDNYQQSNTTTNFLKGYYYNFYGLNINLAGTDSYYTTLRDSIKDFISNNPEYGRYFVAFVSRPNTSNSTTCQCFITDYPEQLLFTPSTDTWGISSSDTAHNYVGLCKGIYDETKPVYHLSLWNTNTVGSTTPTPITQDIYIAPFRYTTNDSNNGDGWGHVGYSYTWGRLFLNTRLKHCPNSSGKYLRVKHYNEYFTHGDGTWCVDFDPSDNTPKTLTSVLNPINSIASVGKNNDLYIVNSNYEWEKLIGASAGDAGNEEDLKAALDSRYLFFLPNTSFNDWGSEENVIFVKERVEHLAKEYGWNNMAFVMAGSHRTANGIFVFKDNPSDNIYRYEKLGASCDYTKHTDSYDAILDDCHYLTIEVNVDTLELVSIGGEYNSGSQRGSFLGTSYDYPIPYTPKYAGSPATKKYVDDQLVNTSYNNLTEKPTLNGVIIQGELTSEDLGINTGTTEESMVLYWDGSTGDEAVALFAKVYSAISTNSPIPQVQMKRSAGSNQTVILKITNVLYNAFGGVVSNQPVNATIILSEINAGSSANDCRLYSYRVDLNFASGTVSSINSVSAIANGKYIPFAYDGAAGTTLTTTNTTTYTPSTDYNPATKKYVDDSIAGASSSPTCVEFLPNLYYHYNGNMIEASTGCTFTTQKGIATLTKCQKADGTYITKVDCSISLEGSLDSLIGNKYLIDTWFSIGELPYLNTSTGTKIYDVKIAGMVKDTVISSGGPLTLQLFDNTDWSKYLYFCQKSGTDYINNYALDLQTGDFKLSCDITYYTTEE